MSAKRNITIRVPIATHKYVSAYAEILGMSKEDAFEFIIMNGVSDLICSGVIEKTVAQRLALIKHNER